MSEKKFSRNCPSCNKEMFYKRKKDCNYSTKHEIVCKSCANYRRALEGNYNPKEEFICKNCNKLFMEWKTQLSNPDTPFCSKKCWYNYRSDITSLVGKKFGKLSVLEKQHHKNTTFYNCLCKCGNYNAVSHTNLLNGTKSCGCLIAETRGSERKPLNEVISRSIWNYYKRNAKNRNYEWNLSFEIFSKLINENCYYCNLKPNKVIWRYKYEQASLAFNGVDRVDNTIGYTVENSVPCCKICNAAKGTLTLNEFKDWSKQLFCNLSNKNI